MKKAIYIPTNQNTVITKDLGTYFEILIDGDFLTVPKDEISLTEKQKIISIEELKEQILINCVLDPLPNIIYSLNSNRLVPEPHQYKPLTKFLNSENNRLLIADEVGLGKTIEAGMIYKEIASREELNISIIVVPSSLTYKWRDELSLRFNVFFDIKKTKDFLLFLDDYEKYFNTKSFDEKIIISYHVLRDDRVIEKLSMSPLEVDFLIMDEAHSFRNEGTSTFESASLITSISEHVLLLTATPVQNNLVDLFNILSLLDDESFMDFDYFMNSLRPNKDIHQLVTLLRNNRSLSEVKENIENAEFIGSSGTLSLVLSDLLKMKELSKDTRVSFIERLNEEDPLSFIINRTKKRDVGRMLPRIVTSVVVEKKEEESDFYKAVIDFVEFIYPNVPSGFITIMPERMASSSMLASHARFKQMRENGRVFFDNDTIEEEGVESIMDLNQKALQLLDNIITKGDLIGDFDSKLLKFLEILENIRKEGIKQIIVFSFFKFTLDYLEEKLLALDYKVGKIHGDFKVDERYDIIDTFRKGKIDILLSSEVGSEGLDLQFCNVVINYDLPWNPMRVEQRIGRIDRIGQKFEKLHIYNLCIQGSIEDRIYLRLYEKLNIFQESLGEIEPILGDLQKELVFPNLLKLSNEELEEKLELKELALVRQKKELSKQTMEFEKLLNEEIIIEDEFNQATNNSKIVFLNKQAKKLFIDYLNSHHLNFIIDKNEHIRLNKDSTRLLVSNLKGKMSDKRQSPNLYREERSLLQQILKSTNARFSFSNDLGDALEIVHININHPIIRLIINDRNKSRSLMFARHPNFQSSFAVAYRINLNSVKKKSWLHVAVLNDQYVVQQEMDLFDFFDQLEQVNNKADIEVSQIEKMATEYIIKKLEQLKNEENEFVKRKVISKKNALLSHYEKKLKRVERQQSLVEQKDILRMRISEKENIISQRDSRIGELEKRYQVLPNFQILSIIKLT